MTERVIPGEAGAIHLLAEPVPAASGSAIICHPHPLYGGGMHDAVVVALARGCVLAGIAPLRFNFRGVGRSEGTFDRGVGETEDVLTLARWHSEEEGTEILCLMGYSFGAGIALAAAARLPVQSLVLVAPPVSMIVPTDVRTLVLLGHADQIVPVAEAKAAFATSTQTRVEVLEHSDHFFGQALDRITRLTGEFLNGA